jgi:hypothetical protein
MSNGEQINLFEELGVEETWKEHWKDMPEYNNIKQGEAFITATFKFNSQEDFDKFHALIKEHLYNDERVFDGKQEVRIKNTWFPLKPRPSAKSYVDEK